MVRPTAALWRAAVLVGVLGLLALVTGRAELVLVALPFAIGTVAALTLRPDASPYSGAELSERSVLEGDRTELQVKVTAVEPDSPAARAGLRPGDVVRRLGDTPIHGIDDLRDVLFFARPEDRFITMVVEREERQQTTFTLPLDRLTEESGPQNLPATSSTPEPAVPSVPAGPG